MRKIAYEKRLAQVVIYCLVSFWGLIFVVPSELQELNFELLPFNWWSNVISIGLLGGFLLAFLFSVFSKELSSQSNWHIGLLGNPWLWSSLLVTYVGINLLFRPNILGVNFALNLIILAIGLPYMLWSFDSIGNWVSTVGTLFLVGGLALNWSYQWANQISYAGNADIEFAHALSLLSLILLSVTSRKSNPWWTVAHQGVFFAVFFFLVTTQLRMPAFIAGTFLVLHSLWQARPWFQRILAMLGNAILAIITWFFFAERSVLQGGSLYISGRGPLYETVALAPERNLFGIIAGQGPGATRSRLLAEIGYSNPHSSVLVMANDYGLIGGLLALGLVVSLLIRIWHLTVGNKSGARVFFVSIALVVSFGALSLFAEAVETTLVVLTALFVFLMALSGLRAERQNLKGSG